MHPILGPRGKLILATGIVFLITGSLSQAVSVLVLGMAILCALMTAYLTFFPTAVLLRNQKVELSWWIPPGEQPGGALTRQRPFQLHLALRNHGRRQLLVAEVRLLAVRGLDISPVPESRIRAGYQVEVTTTARSQRAAYQVIHGATVTLADWLGLFSVTAYFPNPIAVRIFPKTGVGISLPIATAGVGAPFDRTGPHVRNQRGLAGDLSEIREHLPGDAFKYVAWKATARRQKLMVKELETEVVLCQQILLDIGGPMRRSSDGELVPSCDDGRSARVSKLDFAIELAASLAQSAISGGDRVGLLTYDSRVFSEVKPGDGHHHYLRILDRLIETQTVVDEDLTDATDGELVAVVARYLAYQEAKDVSVPSPPAIDDPMWDDIQAGPSGDLYDLSKLAPIVADLLRVIGRSSQESGGDPSWAWSPPLIGPDSRVLMRDLRLFCRLRGIELPYRHEHPHRAHGLEQAFGRSTSTVRADSTFIISDFDDISEDSQTLARALSRARRPGAGITWIFPYASAASSAQENPHTKAAIEAFDFAQSERIASLRRFLLSHGVKLVAVRQSESIPSVVARILRRPGSGRRAA